MAEPAKALKSDYDLLMAKAKDIIIIGSIQSLASWDMETKMPPKGIKQRSQQLAILSQIEHQMTTSSEIGTLLSKIEKHVAYETLNELQKRNVYLMKKQYDEQTKLPEKLVVETARQQALTIDTWKKAKTAKDFSMFKPELEKLLALRKEAAKILMKVKETRTPYDALIDIFEPRMTSEMIAKIFGELREGLVKIIKKCATAPEKPQASILMRKIPPSVQQKISNELAQFIDYDVKSPKAGGRIDETEHPFTNGYYDDVRITTHYYENNPASSLFSVLHEGGHAIYEQNLNPEWLYQPVGMGASLGFHESQSRFVENIIGRSREFWTYFYPKLNLLASNAFSDVALDDFVRAINQVKPSKIRVEADEVTYCLHIIIRFEIERELIANKIAVADLPEIWNRKYHDYLGVEIQNDSEGVMQDIHWASGYYGYFPTYALGNIYSGQLLTKLRKDIPIWQDQIRTGDFLQVKKWLTENVHQHGNLYDPADLIKRITGESLNVQPYLKYLDEKCAWIYGY
ncbi:MAG: carboxypeptidase M32 [Candidatus Bathyarchaeota archaeon]|nr:MAG: carboxypeptidase M32 [Candidatus Bathyarchaeota archaeon]